MLWRWQSAQFPFILLFGSGYLAINVLLVNIQRGICSEIEYSCF
jgi:hypothetical protein